LRIAGLLALRFHEGSLVLYPIVAWRNLRADDRPVRPVHPFEPRRPGRKCLDADESEQKENRNISFHNNPFGKFGGILAT
jgi:hypothetical protein